VKILELQDKKCAVIFLINIFSQIYFLNIIFSSFDHLMRFFFFFLFFLVEGRNGTNTSSSEESLR